MNAFTDGAVLVAIALTRNGGVKVYKLESWTTEIQNAYYSILHRELKEAESVNLHQKVSVTDNLS